jgi:ribose transport system permease protein
MILMDTSRTRSVRSSEVIREYGTLIALACLVGAFSLLSPAVFPTLPNAINILRQISLLAIIATGATVVTVVGEFDLSIGAMASFGGVLAAGWVSSGMNIGLAVLLALLLSFVFGLANGFLITYFGVYSFITTLAMGTILGGVTFWYTGGSTIFGGIPDAFLWFGQSNLGPIPVPTILMFVVVVTFWFVLSSLEFGRRLYAIGGNPTAARLCGINVRRDKTIAFGLTAVLAAATGIILASRLGSAHPTAGGGLFLQSYAAVFLGMTAFSNGVPNVWGTFVGSLIIGVLANGLTILNVPYFLQDIITGCIIILAVIAQSVEARR